ncbi:Putative 2EXR domain-containing protein [Septoria linicola]|uniref:2EXR domain-containing protein n=1 Tax=Septoria linicola TaxID=215465 RepID=A0A9Q9ENR0_9PEZI|nr:putative 2EXR domain-containing protein [Septoria linicola]USW56897.1 Putative 2EXR domain-containing protein [Septoria linicola]
MGFSNPLKRSFLCLTAEPGSVCAGLPKKQRPAPAPLPTQIAPPKSQFLSLPAELRNEIYSHALVQRCPIQLPYAYETRSSTRSSPHTIGKTVYAGEPPLLSASRTIRAEAMPIYYGCNIFEAPSPAAAYKFLKPLAFAKVRSLRMFRPVELVLPVSAQKRWFESVKRCVNRLVKDCGKGALGWEAVSVPVRRGVDGGVRWVGLREAGFRVRMEGADGVWSVEEDLGVGEEDVVMG